MTDRQLSMMLEKKRGWRTLQAQAIRKMRQASMSNDGCISEQARNSGLVVGISLLVAFLIILIASVCHAEEINIDMSKIAHIESSGNPLAHNKKDDSIGLYQITPIVLKEYNNFHPKEQLKRNDLWDPKNNHNVASWYLNKRIPQLLKHFKLADTIQNRIIAYNAGIKNVIQGRIPKITKLYLKKYNS